MDYASCVEPNGLVSPVTQRKCWRYNDSVPIGCALVVVIVGTGMLAQSVLLSCPADRPVYEIIAELSKQQSKRKHRVTNPLPEVTYIWGWCIDHSRTPPTVPEPVPRAETQHSGDASSASASSNTTRAKECHDAMEQALAAAHNVEVGDYYFGKKNYDAALLRYDDAREEKPRDIAVHVRLGRVLERLKQLPRAIEEYKAALKLSGPQKWSDEAKSALLRLEGHPS
jgi:tetratricopeptide (TPR) repeat protein